MTVFSQGLKGPLLIKCLYVCVCVFKEADLLSLQLGTSPNSTCFKWELIRIDHRESMKPASAWGSAGSPVEQAGAQRYQHVQMAPLPPARQFNSQNKPGLGDSGHFESESKLDSVSVWCACEKKEFCRFKAATEDLLQVEIQQQALLEEQQSIAFGGGDYHFWNYVRKPFVGHVTSPGMWGPRFEWDKLGGIYCMCQSPSVNAHLHRTIAHKCIRSLNNRTISEMDAGRKKKKKKG